MKKYAFFVTENNTCDFYNFFSCGSILSLAQVLIWITQASQDNIQSQLQIHLQVHNYYLFVVQEAKRFQMRATRVQNSIINHCKSSMNNGNITGHFYFWILYPGWAQNTFREKLLIQDKDLKGKNTGNIIARIFGNILSDCTTMTSSTVWFQWALSSRKPPDWQTCLFVL